MRIRAKVNPEGADRRPRLGPVLWQLTRGHRGRFAVAAVAFTVKSSPVWLMPVLVSRIVDLVVAHGTLTQLWIYGGLGVVLLAQNYPLNMLFVRLFSRGTREISFTLRTLLAERMQELSILYYTRSSAAFIQNKLVRDVESVEGFIDSVLPLGLSSVLTLIGAFVATGISEPAFLPILLIAVPIGGALVTATRRPIARGNEKYRNDVELLSSRAGEMASMVNVVRAHGIEEVAVSRLTEAARGVQASGFHLDILIGRFGAVGWIAFQALSLFAVLGGAFIALGGVSGVTAGDIVLLGSYVALLTGSVISLTGLAPVISRGINAMGSIASLLDERDLEPNHGKIEVSDPECRITFADVTYSYSGQIAPAVDGVSMELAPGGLVALVGSSGSGKSTLLNLALGFLRPTAGQVLLDGVNLEHIDRRTFRRFVSVVPQEAVMFRGTIRENVTYGSSGFTEEEIYAALHEANALDFVRQFTDGLDTAVGERGAQLSGGQRQRIALARALIRVPRLLLLDEATSALDSESEALIRESLVRSARSRSTLVIAHRLTTVRAADTILVVENGKIVEHGNHHALLKLRGRYSELYQTQMN